MCIALPRQAPSGKASLSSCTSSAGTDTPSRPAKLSYGARLRSAWRSLGTAARIGMRRFRRADTSGRAAGGAAGSDEAEDGGPKFDQALFDEQMSKCAAGLSSFRAAMSDAQSEVYVGTDCFGHRSVWPHKLKHCCAAPSSL